MRVAFRSLVAKQVPPCIITVYVHLVLGAGAAGTLVLLAFALRVARVDSEIVHRRLRSGVLDAGASLVTEASIRAQACARQAFPFSGTCVH